ncbi:glycosyltransferase [Sulfitobacter sp. JB4-11]|uniref:glycosyltransferase n=1 Tax=Sulfitobacter rhodophyticola TaxID=3238304 RepID=UPI003D81B90A
MSKPSMLMIAPAPAVLDGADIRLDGKFASGMTTQAGHFPGPFDCILRAFDGSLPFTTEIYDPKVHPFGLTVLAPDAPVTAEHLAGYDVLLCSADDDRNLGLTGLLQGQKTKLVATLEYTLETRRQISALEQHGNPLRRIIRDVRLRLREQKRNAFLHAMDALQANGYPAYEVCKSINDDTLLFLDNRMTRDMCATAAEMAARRDRLLRGDPLALVFSGRLERMKGAHDLLPVAKLLDARGVAFELDIYGEGSLVPAIESEIAAAGLGKRVRLHKSVDFETVLVPVLRDRADVFLCCHRQSDPSCTYIESMACGLAVAGFANDMWRDLQEQSDGGWTCPMGDHVAMADLLATLDQDRAGVADACQRALDFAADHDFDTLSRERMAHLSALAMQ